MTRWPLFALGSFWLLASACKEFPSIAASGCGNHVVDGSESCDGFPRLGGSSCRPPGSAFECQFDCSVHEGGRREQCPSGWGCDLDSVCREPSGEFTKAAAALEVGAWSLTSGDFDGDGRDDVMSSEPLDAIGETRLRFFYFDEKGALSDARPFAKSLISPTIKEISGDAASDLVFSQSALGMMFGRTDRNWLPETFSSYRVPNATVRVVGVHDRSVELSPPFASLITYPWGTGFYLADTNSGLLTERVHVVGKVADLVGDVVSGNIIEDIKHSPCLEPVFAMRGAKRFNVVDICDTDEGGTLVWREKGNGQLFQIALEPPAAIDSAPQVLDLNGDGHLDVLLGAGGRPYAAYGDGSSLATAVPFANFDAQSFFFQATPLAVADFTGDGALDFVFADGLLSSTTAYLGATPRYTAIAHRLSAPWTAAKIADFNGNGKLDIVAASSGSLNFEFFNGTGTQYFTESIVSTSAAVQLLTAGDFDGDSITDLALFEVPPPGQDKSTLKISFGAAFAPLAAPVAVAQVVRPEALSSFASNGRANLTICSNELIASVPNGALTLLAGGPDRVPFAPFTLTEFSSMGTVQDAGAYAVVAGNFTKVDQPDLIALAFYPGGSLGVQPTNDVWSLPAITTPGSFPQRLPEALHQRLNPLTFSENQANFSADVAGASADLDGDQRDEAIFAMPADGGAHCGVLWLGADSAGSFGSAKRVPAIIDEPCGDPQIIPVNADDDEFTDLALLTGSRDADDRHLYVLWNDGSGRFSGTDVALVSAGDSPQAFTVLPHAGANPDFAYVTKNFLRVVQRPGPREFAPPSDLPVPMNLSLNGGSGITAADVNGDHVTDLVFAESGKLSVLRARLKVP